MMLIVRHIILIGIALQLLLACNKGEDLLPTGIIKISSIINQQNYLAPVVLEKNNESIVLLNGQEIVFDHDKFELNDAGFYEMVIDLTDTILFVLIDSERGEAEWGLKKWVPIAPAFNESTNTLFEIIHPNFYIEGAASPVIIKAQNPTENLTENYFGIYSNDKIFYIKNGMGSFNTIQTSPKLYVNINGKETHVSLSKSATEISILDHDIASHYVCGINSVTHLTKNITITTNGSLTLNEGAILMIDEGINILNYGPIYFNGSGNNPVLVTCTNGNRYFGGFISEGAASKIEATHTFFTRFGHHSEQEYQYGHAKHQALFKSENTFLNFSHCYFLDTPGQVFFPYNCKLSLDHCIVQRAKTGGQINSSTIIINASYFTDFPNDSQNYSDDDNDALYLSASNATINTSVFMYAKDDGIDTGGSEGGTIAIDSCLFEACFHEGLAMSSGNTSEKTHWVKNSTFLNCQQGAELGYSSPNHRVFIENCSFISNYIGLRYGDNYENEVNGQIWVSHSNFKNNYRQYWNMVRKNWKSKDHKLIIE